MSSPIGGINRRALDRLVRQLGGSISGIRRTGELRYSHPLVHLRVRINARRKDAPQHLVNFVHRVQRALAERLNKAAA